MERLKNKVAVITGGTSGIALATAEAFIQEGAKVILTGRDKRTVDQAMQNLGHSALGVVYDAGKMADITLLKKEVQRMTADIDVLFVNAGYGKFAPLEAVTESLMDELFNVLVKGSFFTAQALLSLMKEGGTIIFNTSVVTQYGAPYTSVYAAAKAAVSSFVKTFASECTQRKIRVNGISPGYTVTNGFQKTGMSQDQIEAVVQSVIPTLPFKRFAQPSEVARTVSFLASDDASYIHGAEPIVDGGYTIIK